MTRGKIDTGIFDIERKYVPELDRAEYLERVFFLKVWRDGRTWLTDTVKWCEKELKVFISDSQQKADPYAEYIKIDAEVLQNLLKAIEDSSELLPAIRRKDKRIPLTLETNLHMAFEAGMAFERIRMRLCSERLQAGGTLMQAVKKGHVAVYGTPEEKEKRWDKQLKEYDRLRKEKPNLSKSACYRNAGEKLGVSAKTIQRAVMRRDKENKDTA